MKIARMTWAAALLALLAGELAGPATVQADTRTFVGTQNKNWFNELNWNPNDAIPDETDHAIIDAECRISDADIARAQKITINSDKMLTILPDGTLVIGVNEEEHDSYVNSGGLMVIDSDDDQPGRLLIAGDHTITGDGGVILLTYKESSIEDDNTGDPDHLTLKGVDTERDESLVVTGPNGIIAVPMYNDAYVIATTGPLVFGLCLLEHDMVGGCDGHWGAEEGGLLLVFTQVTGPAVWQTQNNDLGMIDGGTIQIGDDEHSGCVAAEDGPVVVIGDDALLRVSENGWFCTTGGLTWQSVDDGDSGTQPGILSIPVSYFSVGACDPVNCSS